MTSHRKKTTADPDADRPSGILDAIARLDAATGATKKPAPDRPLCPTIWGIFPHLPPVVYPPTMLPGTLVFPAATRRPRIPREPASPRRIGTDDTADDPSIDLAWEPEGENE